MLVIFDIETIKNDRADEYFAQKTYKPKANLKDPAKIAADIEAKRQEDRSKAGLNWYTGRVACISWACWYKRDVIFHELHEDESVILKNFFNKIQTRFGNTQLCGKNSKTFDIPFLIGRCIALNIGLPPYLKKQGLVDIDDVFGFSSMCSQKSKLEDYAWGMGIGGKICEGSKVQGMWDSEEFDKIAEYCDDDVRITMEFASRYHKDFKFHQEEGGSSYADQL